MIDPFDADLPLLIAFSGGRTSGLMLRRYLDFYGGKLPDGSHAIFCNTGKERPETLDFVHEIERRWAVPIIWLEYRHVEGRHAYVIVDYSTASRDGRPFDDVVRVRSMLPNRVARYCTAELKVKTMWRWARNQPHLADGYSKAIGLRHDEPGRCERIMQREGRETRASEKVVLPLNEAKLTEADVMSFWAKQPFDLDLAPHEGNCDLCFLKRKAALLEIMSRRPDLAQWWIDQERIGKGTFRTRADRPAYESLSALAGQPRLFPLSTAPEDEFDTGLECACTD